MRKFISGRLNYKIFFTLSTVLAVLFLFIEWVAYNYVQAIILGHIEEDLKSAVGNVERTVRTSAVLSARSYLRSVAEQSVHHVQELYELSQSGKISAADAKEKAKESILENRIGSSGYCYVIDLQGIVLAHPRAALIGENVAGFPFVQEQLQKKQGLVEYLWQNPEEKAARPKILFMAYFKPWGWIISASAYKEELYQLIEPKDFRENVQAIKIGTKGFPFVVTHDGNVLIHPKLSGDISGSKAAEATLVREIIEKHRDDAVQRYAVPDGENIGQELVYSSLVKDFNWLVAAVGNEDDFLSPLHRLRKIFLGILVLGVCCAVFVSLYLSNSITEPLNRLLVTLSERSKELGMTPFTRGERDEIESISDYCMKYIDRLRVNNLELRKVLDEQTRVALDLSIFKEVFENSAEGITITDLEGKIIAANPAFERITGYSLAEVAGSNPRILKSNKHPPEFYQQMWVAIREFGFWSGEIWNRRRNGEIYPERLTISAIRDSHGETTHYAAIFNDISTIMAQQERIEYLAYHDALTNLPNRLLLLDRLSLAMASCRRDGGEVVCMIVDVDNFKTVNDSMGHETGDQLLKMLVERVLVVIREVDTLARMGGDEFIYVYRNPVPGISSVIPVIERFQRCLGEPFVLLGQKIYISVSIGVSVYPKDSGTTHDLIKQADLALYKAKQVIGNSYQFFSRDMEVAVKKKFHLLAKLRSGLDQQEFLPFFQPKVDLQSGRVTGMEGLARWRSGGGLISPADFIPLAEESGLIVPLARQIYHQAFAETKKLRDAGYDLNVSVNLAPFQLKYEKFLDELGEIQRDNGLPPDFIEFEVTESSLMENLEKSKKILRKLAGDGYRIAIDDFGTGYSSLQYLKQLPITTLKIDMSFVAGIGNDREDETLIKTIILMARQFGLEIVAEGVEEKFQEEFLRSLGCQSGQGYLYGKPMEAGVFSGWLGEHYHHPLS